LRLADPAADDANDQDPILGVAAQVLAEP